MKIQTNPKNIIAAIVIFLIGVATLLIEFEPGMHDATPFAFCLLIAIVCLTCEFDGNIFS